ncbi:Hypothetical predicted protein [Cloeon dipterum]|uniref:Uncharacterized protein n=1 Tax=Cloeon dipterum TaxID=197152 RepID=A0A8S1D9L4_9INSE|nr:Hypothetical predicted protein [Cloeon dipterum]
MLKEILEMEENHHSRCDGREDQFAKEWAMLPFLINSKFYTKLDTHYFTRIYCLYATLSNSRFQEFIRCLGANTPYLRELNIYCPTRNGEYSLEERELNSIILLKNLAILTITRVSVPLSGIVDISRRCEKLKMLEASDVTIDVESSRVTFRNDFVYVYMDSRHFVPGRMNLWMDTTMQKLDPRYAENKQYTKLCLRPNKSSDFILVHMFAEKLSDIEIDFSRLKDVEEMNDFPLLPELKYAKMHCGGESANALRCFMKRNGETLQELSLEGVDIKENMTWHEIDSLCPNLQSLQLYSCILSGIMHHSLSMRCSTSNDSNGSLKNSRNHLIKSHFRALCQRRSSKTSTLTYPILTSATICHRY